MTSGFVEVEVRGRQGSTQVRSEAGTFTSEVDAACQAAAGTAAREGASEAANIYGGSGKGWTITFRAEGGGQVWEIVAEGQWAEAAEFGIPAHPISPHGDYSLANKADDFGPIMPPGRGVMHSGTKAIHMVKLGGDIAAADFENVLVSYLP